MKYKNIVQEITLSGVLMALAIALSFANFKIGGGSVYLVGISIFMMPLVLRIQFSLITGIFSVIIADAISGWIAFTWISVIAYGFAILVIWLFSLSNKKFIFIVGLIVASGLAVAIYFFLEWITFDKSLAITDAIATSIQFAIVIPVVSLLYFPIKLIINSSANK